MDLKQHHCVEILDKFLSGVTVETLAEEYGVTTGIIEIIRVGKLRFADGTKQLPIINIKGTLSDSLEKLKCTPEEIDEICERYRFGDSAQSIAKDFGIVQMTVQRYVDLRHVIRGTYNSTVGSKKELLAFLSKVRKALWRHNGGREHPTYEAWQAETQRLWKTGKYSKDESMVLAARKFEMSRPFFEEYNVSQWDPEARATQDDTEKKNITKSKSVPGETETPPLDSNATIECEGKDQTYRENLAWAIKAVGYQKRTGIPPVKCPNDTAYWLYNQAISEPKEFLTKVSAMEMKTMVVDNSETDRRTALRSMDDLDSMLMELTIE